MKSLIILRQSGEASAQGLGELASAAAKIAPACDVLVLGGNTPELLVPNNVEQIFRVATSDNYLVASALAKTLSGFCRSYSHVLMAADSFGKDLLPRIGGILDIAQLSDVVEIISPQVFKRPIYAGNALVEVESLEEINLLTIRTQAFSSNASDIKIVAAQALELEFSVDDRIKFIERTHAVSGDIPPLAQAKVIVSGGRSLGSAENFNHLIHQLAVKFGGAVGATRAAVEAGYATNDIQVGQTGQIVAPPLYIAVGVSGAVQHIAGMKDSKIVVAINSDENAQIFEYADYGVVGDLFEIVPQLLEKL